MYTLMFKHNLFFLVFSSLCLPAHICPAWLVLVLLNARTRLSCCDMDQSGTLWNEPPWTCQMLHRRNRPTFPTSPLKGRGYKRVSTPTMLCLRAGKSRPALKSTLNGDSYASTQIRWPKTHPLKRPVMLHMNGLPTGTANHISFHDQWRSNKRNWTYTVWY